MASPRRLAVAAWPLEQVLPDLRNPRTHPAAQIDQVAVSIREFGWTNPILVDPSGTIIAGEARRAAALALGMKEVPVIVIEGLTVEQRRAYQLADNKIPLGAGWNEDLLSEVLSELDAADFDLAAAGFSERELSELIESVDRLAIGLPELPSGERQPFQQMTFTLHDSQAETVKAALRRAKEAGPFDSSPNLNANGNALDRICAAYIGCDGRG